MLLIEFLLGSTQKIERLVVHDLWVVPRKYVGVRVYNLNTWPQSNFSWRMNRFSCGWSKSVDGQFSCLVMLCKSWGVFEDGDKMWDICAIYNLINTKTARERERKNWFISSKLYFLSACTTHRSHKELLPKQAKVFNTVEMR